jgi:hypothetical protein
MLKLTFAALMVACVIASFAQVAMAGPDANSREYVVTVLGE